MPDPRVRSNRWYNGFFLEERPLIYVSVHNNESIDSALKRFNLKLQSSGLLRELKEHSHYEKPSEQRRRAKRRRSSSRI